MRNVGIYLFLFALASIVLYFMDMNLKLLMWIDMWGPTAGWAIRIGMAVVGIVLFLAGRKEQEAPAPSA